MDEYGIFNIKSHFNVKNEDSSSSKTLFHDKTEQHLEEEVQKNTVIIEQEPEITEDKKKLGKIEL